MPTTIEALVIVALVLSPGLIFTQIARRVIAHVEEPTDVRFLLTIITAGTAIHALVFPWTIRIADFYLGDHLRSHRWEAFGWAVVAVFLVPLGLGIVVGRLAVRPGIERALDYIGLGYIDRMPSAWDYVMRQRHPYHVRIHLKDGGVIGGVFANQSFGSLNPRRTDVYLEEAWQFDEDGNLRQAVPNSRGLWISHEVVSHVQFFEGLDDQAAVPRAHTGQSPARAEAGHRQARGAADRQSQALPAAADATAAHKRSRRRRR